MSYLDKATEKRPPEATFAAFTTGVSDAARPDIAKQNELTWRPTGIPRRLWGHTLAETAGQYGASGDVAEWAREYPQRHALDANGYPIDRNGYGRGLFLYGAPATGKTTLACALLTSMRKLYSLPVYFARWDGYLKAKQWLVREANDRFEETVAYENTVIGVESFDIAVLDDVGHEYSSGSRYGETLLDQVVRSRYDRGLPTIITTNLSEMQWTTRYDATLTSFIKRACAPVAFGVGDAR